jgi:Uma2 family endonuclease
VRVTYDHGKLEIMSPLRKHEKYKEFVGDLVKALAEDGGIAIESSGSTTWRLAEHEQGTEPDLCFHIATAERVIGKDELDLRIDPPPDLAIEIDTTNESLGKFPIYANLGVPEIWRYIDKQKRAAIYILKNGRYAETAFSLSFPVMTAEILADFIGRSETAGQQKALNAFRIWLRSI